jgi:hypothetical protein
VNNRFSSLRARALAAGGVGVAALGASVAIATTASAAPQATASCKGISFKVLHNDSSGGVTLPQGNYTVSSPNLACIPASKYFTTFLNKYNHAIPGWKGKAIAKGWGTYTKNGSKTQFTVKWANAKKSGGGGGTGSSGGKTCKTSQLKVTLGRANATAGTTYFPLKFVNTSKTSCTLRGYPGVSAVNKSGNQIGNAAKRTGGKVRTVTVKPGKQQSSSVGVAETGNFSPAACKPVMAAGMKIFPPNAATSVIIKKKFSTCSSKASTSLSVKPVK